LHHKFVNTLDRIAPGARLFRKSGSWKNWHSDSILVWGDDGRKYILVALIEDADGENIIRNLVQPAELALRKSVILPTELEDSDGVVVRQDT
jgi:beta-lactamase class A